MSGHQQAALRAGRPLRAGSLVALAFFVGTPGWCAVAAQAAPPALTPLDDADLASVNGRDGLAFNLSGFSLAPIPGVKTTITYGMPGSTTDHPYTFSLSNFTLSRTDDADVFADPYYLDLVARPGLADLIRISFPKNAGLSQLWNFTADLNITTDQVAWDLGNLQLKNLGLQGGGLDITTPATAGIEGVAFGLSTRLSLEQLVVRPRGFADSTQMFAINGLTLEDAASHGPWSLADATTHPGLFNAVTEDGQSSLHLQIGWPTAGAPDVPIAAITIDKIAFTTNGVEQSLGSSRIGGLQINYMDVKFRPGP